MADAPQLSLPLEATVEPAALVLARRLAPLLSASPVSREALRPHVQNRTVGPAVGVSSAAGLARLRLPLEWLASPSVAEALFGAEGGDAAEASVQLSVEEVGASASLAWDALQDRGGGGGGEQEGQGRQEGSCAGGGAHSAIAGAGGQAESQADAGGRWSGRPRLR